jgi:hypothetical protein
VGANRITICLTIKICCDCIGRSEIIYLSFFEGVEK